MGDFAEVIVVHNVLKYLNGSQYASRMDGEWHAIIVVISD